MPFATAEQLSALPLASLITDQSVICCRDVQRQFDTEAFAEEHQEPLKLLSSILMIHGRFRDAARPYGPMWTDSNGRSLIPADLKGEQTTELHKFLSDIENPTLRARVADIVWFNDRSLRDAAEVAIAAYADRVEQYLDGEASFRFDPKSLIDHRAMKLLRRAFQISKAIKGKNPHPDRIIELVERIDVLAFQENDLPSIKRVIELRLDFETGDEEKLAERAEQALADDTSGDEHWMSFILEELRRIYRRNDQSEKVNDVQIRIAESAARRVKENPGSAMFQSHWLMTAIGEIRKARGPEAKAKAQEFRARLKEVQQDSVFEMGTISEPIDLTGLVKETEARFEDLTLADAFGQFASLYRSVSPETLRKQAQKTAAEHPLSHMMSTSHVDEEGKTTARTDGFDLTAEQQEQAVLDAAVSRDLSLIRSMAVTGQINPARRYIRQRLEPSRRHFQVLALNSPFVPKYHEGVFAIGFEHFFAGDMVSAASVLIPQLENSLRYVLKIAGADPSTIESDLTQDDRSISSLLTHERDKLEEIFGADLVYEMDLLFNFRPGPALRHETAHGKMSAGQFHSDEVVFGCWLLFRMVCLPLFSHWEKLAAKLHEL